MKGAWDLPVPFFFFSLQLPLNLQMISKYKVEKKVSQYTFPSKCLNI